MFDISISVILRSAKADERSVLHMKKLYSAPSLELLAYCSLSYIGNDDPWGEDLLDSKPWNDGELGGWT